VQSLPALLPEAVANHWITPSDSDRLLGLHKLRPSAEETREISVHEVQAALEFCVELIDKHW
ncbi:MAG TPA: hypothetical protein VKR81_09715, partial [Candidatus Binatia bacterium]|nr:hypothetical protein [Candidatus Binatia bacterium]